jgi:hypothetical protein
MQGPAAISPAESTEHIFDPVADDRGQ